MVTLGELAEKNKGRKYITDLPEVSLNTPVKSETFIDPKDPKKMKEVTYYFMELEGTKYIIPSGAITAIHDVKEARPFTTKVKVIKQAGGNFSAIPLD